MVYRNLVGATAGGDTGVKEPKGKTTLTQPKEVMCIYEVIGAVAEEQKSKKGEER